MAISYIIYHCQIWVTNLFHSAGHFFLCKKKLEIPGTSTGNLFVVICVSCAPHSEANRDESINFCVGYGYEICEIGIGVPTVPTPYLIALL